ncbi:MAG: hypothetical protein LBD15_00880 [Holosporales bacterium]|jgi:hypothetical protein|nr:hypothetical protein [Holosporales bacterium]
MENPDDPLRQLNDPALDPQARLQVARNSLIGGTVGDPAIQLRAAQILAENIDQVPQDQLQGLPMMVGMGHLDPRIRPLILQAVLRAPNADQETRLFAARELVNLPDVEDEVRQEARNIIIDQ